MRKKPVLIELENVKLFPRRIFPSTWEEIIRRQGEVREDRAIIVRYNVIAERYYEAIYKKRGSAWELIEGPYPLKGETFG